MRSRFVRLAIALTFVYASPMSFATLTVIKGEVCAHTYWANAHHYEQTGEATDIDSYTTQRGSLYASIPLIDQVAVTLDGGPTYEDMAAWRSFFHVMFDLDTYIDTIFKVDAYTKLDFYTDRNYFLFLGCNIDQYNGTFYASIDGVNVNMQGDPFYIGPGLHSVKYYTSEFIEPGFIEGTADMVTWPDFATPEPSSIGFLALGILSISRLIRRKRA